MNVWKAYGGLGRAVRARQRAPQQAVGGGGGHGVRGRERTGGAGRQQRRQRHALPRQAFGGRRRRQCRNGVAARGREQCCDRALRLQRHTHSELSNHMPKHVCKSGTGR